MDEYTTEDITEAIEKSLDEEVESLLRQALAARTEWDEAPELYLILEKDGKLELETVLSPEWEIWNVIPDPVRVLLTLSQALSDADLMAAWPEEMSLVPSEGFCGVAFRVEAWGIKYSKDSDPEVQERLKRASVEHDIHLQPERIECRQMMARMRNGSTYWVQQERGQEPSRMEDASGAEGRVPDALKGIMEGLSRMAAAQN